MTTQTVRAFALAGAILSLAAVRLTAQAPPMQFPPPLIQAKTVQLSRHTYVIPDGETTLVPNVGIVVGSRATLVIDTGMGNRNARTVLAEVAKVSKNRTMYLATTHAHAEHTSGMGAFPADTTFVVAKAQQEELDAFGDRVFTGVARLSPFIAELLQGATLRKPGIVFDREHVLDLGGVTVRLIWVGPAHSKGDTAIVVEGEGIVFAGDLAPRQRFPSFSPDSTRARFITAMNRVEALKATVFVPCHGSYGDGSVFAEQRTVLEAMAARVAVLKKAGQSLDATTKTVAAEFAARYPGWRATIPNNVDPIVSALYAE